MNHYDTQIAKTKELLSEESLQQVQEQVNALAANLRADKARFGKGKRTSDKRVVPFTFSQELNSILTRTNDIGIKIQNIKHREDVLRTKIEKMTKKMTSYNLRVPVGPSDSK